MAFRKRVSITLVMEDLKLQIEEIAKAEAHLAALLDERNQTMVELKAAGIPERTLVKLTGLSLSRISKITAGCRRGAAALDLETRLSG